MIKKLKNQQNYWLIKSEPDCYSIDNLKHDKKTLWSGVRNFQARNFLRDMRVGDQVLFYHSGSKPAPAVVGVCVVSKVPEADLTAQDKKDEHFDPKATKENPIWIAVEMKYVSTLKDPVTLSHIKISPKLRDMVVAQQGSRLSVQPVSEQHFKEVVKSRS